MSILKLIKWAIKVNVRNVDALPESYIKLLENNLEVSMNFGIFKLLKKYIS